MKRFFIFAFMLTICSAGQAADTNLALKLEWPGSILRVGQESRLRLKIVGGGLGEMIQEVDGAGHDAMKVNTFGGELVFKPEKEGVRRLGPFTVTVNGRKLTSNSFDVQVLPPWDGTYGTEFMVDKTQTVVGVDLQLVIETWSDRPTRFLFTFRNRNGLVMSSSASSSSTTVRDGEKVYCSRQVYSLTPQKAGEYKITKDSFIDFPADVTPPNITVEVKPLAGADAAPSPAPVPVEFDPSGEWEGMVPAGHKLGLMVQPMKDGRYNIPGLSVFAGIYEWKGKRLIITEPKDKRLTEFIWELNGTDTLVLIQSSTETGANYKGATLKRVK